MFMIIPLTAVAYIFSSVGGACVSDAVFLEKSIPIKSVTTHNTCIFMRYFITNLQMNIDMRITFYDNF